MTGLAISLIITASLAADPASYSEAHASARESGKPILVLVGADWCPGCRTLKYQTLPRLQRAGKLNKFEFAQVDADRESGLANRLMRGNSIPQLILYTRSANGWSRTQLTGAQADQAIESFLGRGLESHAPVRSASANEPVEKPTRAGTRDTMNGGE